MPPPPLLLLRHWRPRLAIALESALAPPHAPMRLLVPSDGRQRRRVAAAAATDAMEDRELIACAILSSLKAPGWTVPRDRGDENKNHSRSWVQMYGTETVP
jgi:hypothetical protein